MDDNQGELINEDIFDELDHVLLLPKEADRLRTFIRSLSEENQYEEQEYPAMWLIYSFWVMKHQASSIGLPANKPTITKPVFNYIEYYRNFIDRLGDMAYNEFICISPAELIFHYWCAGKHALNIDVPSEELACAAILAESIRREEV